MTALPFRAGWGEVRFVPASHGATRLERLERLHLIAKDSELNAMPCTPERALRRERADRIMDAIRDERRAQAPTIPCGTCGQPATPSAGLCDRCRESYEASLDSDRRWWMEGGL